MMKRNANSYVNGTAALKMPRWVESPDEATIIAFPSSRSICHADAFDRSTGALEESPRKAASWVKHLMDASEMYCSLRYESMLGVPYNLFTNKGVAVLSVGAAAVGIVSLILGV